MKTPVLLIAPLLAALLASLPAHAQIYQYKDASGKTVISDRPPPGGADKARTLAGETPAANAAAAPANGGSAADRDLEFKKRQKEQKEAASKAQKDAADKVARNENCDRARRQLQILESGERVTTRDDKGERVYIEDNQRAAEIDRARKFIAETCK